MTAKMSRICQMAARSVRAPCARATESRGSACALIVIAALSLAPVLGSRASEDRPIEAPASTHGDTFGGVIKRDAKAVGAMFKEGAHRVAVASKTVAHEVATAAKRGAAETRAAFRGQKTAEPGG